ncbi:hypothetical protein BLNAU_7478 [Blattamonas nauphoetae]|uniref:HAT C-terminal dimerisation domain-containing protein n=1 Tax=Blattamonas nauphoetae TaxID=2049346 RepID=A0ABQ9Y1N5_9EUKA|nr:hypothetical protein BLNAU_7478 [Blattamonas nauphoetae]
MNRPKTSQQTLLQCLLRVEQRRLMTSQESSRIDRDDDDDNLIPVSGHGDQEQASQEENDQTGPEETPESHPITASARLRHLYPSWIARPECQDSDNKSIFILQESGIFCRICSSLPQFLRSTRKEYVTKPSNPCHPHSLLDHLTSGIHCEALKIWKDQHRCEQADHSPVDARGLHQHRMNEVQAVNFIAHRRNAVEQFQPTTDLLNSVSNKHFIGKNQTSNSRKFWSIAETIDVLFQKKRTAGITKTIPLAATIDTSTDFTSTTMLCVNLRFLVEGKMEVLLVGLEEMSEGSNGVQLFQSFLSVITEADLQLGQIVCVTTDGDPAMVGAQKGFLAQLRAANPLLLHHHCQSHRLHLSLQHSFDDKSKPEWQVNINNCIRFINSITRSHSKKTAFQLELRKRRLPEMKLSKPCKVRWNTFHRSVSQTIHFSNVIISIHRTDPDPKTAQLCVFFQNPTNFLRSASLDYILEKTSIPLKNMQSAELSLSESREIVMKLIQQLEGCNPEVINDQLIQKMKTQGFDEDRGLVDDMTRERLEMGQVLSSELHKSFFSPDCMTDFNFLSHEYLLLPITPITDQPFLQAASTFKRFVPPLIQLYTTAHWHFMKTQYQLYFSSSERTPTQILNLLLSNEHFKTCSAALPVLLAIKTISATSVSTEREFSILHYTKRKERSRLSTQHLAILTRISHNSPELLSSDEIDMILSERWIHTNIRKEKRDQPDIDASEDETVEKTIRVDKRPEFRLLSPPIQPS